METIYIVDAFTDRPFAGNPAAVCVLSGDKPDSWLQAVAMELNLAETAFVWAQASGFRIRWFTPESEEELCGHATLASAHILWEQGYLAGGAHAVFASRSGRLTADRTNDGDITLNFPAEPAAAICPPRGLAELLGLTEADLLWTGRNRLDYIVELASEQLVRSLKPDFAALRTLVAALDFRGVIVTARGSRTIGEAGVAGVAGALSVSTDSAFDCVSRFFCAEPTVPEDPVTGSAHCCIGPYWAGKLGRTDLVAYQASARGGVLKLAMKGDRVELGGRALTVLKGQLLV